MSRLRLWSRGLGPVLPAAGVAIVAVVLIATWPMLHWPYPRWAATSAQWHQQWMWAGPIAGTAAAWYATRFNPRHRIWNQLRAPRLGPPVVARHLRLLGLFLVGAYVVALLPLTVETAVRGGVGSPAPLVMFSGVLAMAAAIGLGYMLGTLVSHLIIVPITALTFCALNILTTAGADTFAPVAPVLYLEPQLGQTESTPLVVFRTALFLLVAGTAAALAAKTLLRHGRGEHRNTSARLADIAVHAVAPIVLIGIALSHQPALFAVAQHATKVCRPVHGVTYCVHTDNQPQLGTLVAAIDPIIVRYGTLPDTMHQVWDQALLLAETPPPHPDSGIAVVPLTADGTIDPAQSGIIESLTGVDECTPAPAGQDHDTVTVQRDLVAFLSHTTPPTGTFAGMSVPQVQDWIRRHHHDIATCTLNPGDLPHPAASTPVPAPRSATPPPSSTRRPSRPSPTAAKPSPRHTGSTVHPGLFDRSTLGLVEGPLISGLSS